MLPRRVVAVSAWLLVSGCARPVAPGQTVHTIELQPPQTSAPPVDPPSILSAHFALDDAPALGGHDALPVVFSVELDASTIVPSSFIVAREDGTRARPHAALLSPANESDENRTVLLIGNFGAPGDRPPTNVAVSGAVYAEDGQSLRGLASAVLAYEVPPTVVLAEQLNPAIGRCPGATSVVRTYWTEGLRGLSADAAARITVYTEDGPAMHPEAFDDQAAAGQDASEDNVLDLCLGVSSRAVRVAVEASVLSDPAGHPNDALDVDVAPGRG